MPSSMPSGTFILTFWRSSLYPLPSHSPHLSLTVSPLPPQYGHSCAKLINPLCCTMRPLPSQCGQMCVLPSLEPVPLQVLHGFFIVNSTSFSAPKTASLNFIFKAISKSSGYLSMLLLRLCELDLNPPPKNELNISPRSISAPNPAELNPPLPSSPALPYLSYIARFCSSPSTW